MRQMQTIEQHNQDAEMLRIVVITKLDRPHHDASDPGKHSTRAGHSKVAFETLSDTRCLAVQQQREQ